MALKKILSPVSDALDKVCSVAIVIMLGLMVVITTAQIICRTFFTSLSWSDEVTRYLPVSLGRMPHERSNEERERKINACIGRVGMSADAGKGSALRCERLQGEERPD